MADVYETMFIRRVWRRICAVMTYVMLCTSTPTRQSIPAHLRTTEPHTQSPIRTCAPTQFAHAACAQSRAAMLVPSGPVHDARDRCTADMLHTHPSPSVHTRAPAHHITPHVSCAPTYNSRSHTRRVRKAAPPCWCRPVRCSLHETGSPQTCCTSTRVAARAL